MQRNEVKYERVREREFLFNETLRICKTNEEIKSKAAILKKKKSTKK